MRGGQREEGGGGWVEGERGGLVRGGGGGGWLEGERGGWVEGRVVGGGQRDLC